MSEACKIKVYEAALSGLSAWDGEAEFTEENRQQYIQSLKDVRAGLALFVTNETLVQFLDIVLDFELQGAEHIDTGARIPTSVNWQFRKDGLEVFNDGQPAAVIPPVSWKALSADLAKAILHPPK